MHELAPGIRHWTARHPNIGAEVSSYWLPDLGVLIDPLDVPGEVEDVNTILLTNRHHRRSSLEARERFGATVHVPQAGMQDWQGEPVEPYEPGDELRGRRRHAPTRSARSVRTSPRSTSPPYRLSPSPTE